MLFKQIDSILSLSLSKIYWKEVDNLIYLSINLFSRCERLQLDYLSKLFVNYIIFKHKEMLHEFFNQPIFIIESEILT